MNNQLTSYKDICRAIQLLSREIKKILQGNFIGMYIHGSLAMGDFNPASSDIDFLVVTKDLISRDLLDSLGEMHVSIMKSENKWGNRLEGSYILKHTLKRKSPPAEPRPYVNGGRLYLAPFGYEWVLEKYGIREYGIVVEGPEPHVLINPVSPKELREASLNMLNEWWRPMLLGSESLRSAEYQAYAVLTMCRILYMFNHSVLISKPKAAKWVQENYGEEWKMLIEKAIQWEKGEAFDNYHQTVEFIMYTLAYINKKDNIQYSNF